VDEQQFSSSKVFDSLEGIEIIKEEDSELDFVIALTTPLQQNIVKKHAETLKRLKIQEKDIFFRAQL
jgi:hypothetical protein